MSKLSAKLLLLSISTSGILLPASGCIGTGSKSNAPIAMPRASSGYSTLASTTLQNKKPTPNLRQAVSNSPGYKKVQVLSPKTQKPQFDSVLELEPIPSAEETIRPVTFSTEVDRKETAEANSGTLPSTRISVHQETAPSNPVITLQNADNQSKENQENTPKTTTNPSSELTPTPLLKSKSANQESAAVSSPEQSADTNTTGQELTFQQALSMAKANNPAISQLHAQIDSLVGKRTQAGLRPNPTIGVNGEDINEDGGAGRYGVYYSQRIVRGGKLELSQQVVDAEIQVANQQLATVERRLETDTKKLFYDLLIATEKEKLASKLVKISKNAAEVSKKLFEAKESSKTVLLQSEIELQETLVLLNQARNQRKAAVNRLGTLIGIEAANRIAVGEVKSGWEVVPQNEAYELILQQNPLVQSLADDIQRSNRVVCRQMVQPIGDVTWQTNLQYDTVNDDIIAGFQVGLPIARNNLNQGAIHQAKQMVVVAGQRLEKQKMKLKIDLVKAYQGYRDAEIQIKAYQDRILPLAKETLDLINEGYRQGESNFLQLLTAQRTYFQTNLAYFDQLKQMWERKIEIDGMLLSGSLND